ncbi:MAG: hypothetical protein DMF90_10765 [Acidobacteria bacterium]|nr:MAG: hypothetical protein DMF90_10765 [Acidobacteriota bacterium]
MRIANLLRRGPLTIAAMAKELDAKLDSVEREVKRGEKRTFIRLVAKDGIGQKRRVLTSNFLLVKYPGATLWRRFAKSSKLTANPYTDRTNPLD